MDAKCENCKYSMKICCGCKKKENKIECFRYLNEPEYPNHPIEMNKNSNCPKFELKCQN